MLSMNILNKQCPQIVQCSAFSHNLTEGSFAEPCRPLTLISMSNCPVLNYTHNKLHHETAIVTVLRASLHCGYDVV